jgi:hypothetical protein
LAVADLAGQFGQRWNACLRTSALAAIGVARHGADDQGVAVHADARQLGAAPRSTSVPGLGQTQLHAPRCRLWPPAKT